ncbi:SLC13 family permease [Celeribacter indicus]|uniref:Transporter n=1 Tax=Celeribacter indicus TaxID=1208324 RepID=A0A0B5DQN4_9RHOB|nr:DASS family sodium-coupled anion symporter [Celeribacter indicus]AJE45838.1 transporter [Celeribacter indicus]SDW61876.1 solute carrier family 13 (sodium-dependent dicarboxylate transporter), member 2/3/5 [Celeribacter indicus]
MADRQNASRGGARETINFTTMALGPVAGLILGLILPESLALPGRMAAGGALWMAIWWMTEAVPIPVTSMLPLVLFPLLGVGSFGQMAAPYASPVVFLVLGGVILGLATEQSNLHRRIALRTIRAVGTRPDQIVLGLMIASAFISAWISNTATAVIMVPIGVSILHLVRDIAREQGREGGDAKFSASIMLGIAYGVTMGSAATLIGQPPTALMKAYLLEQHGYDMGFAQWMAIGVPFAAIMLVVGWLLLTKLIFRPEMRELPGGAALIRSEIDALGPMTKAESRVALIFLGAIFFWVAVPLLTRIAAVDAALPFLSGISSDQVAMTAAVACFLVSSGERDDSGRPVALLSWSASREIPWGLLLLFGGGLSLSAAFTATGLSVWIGNQVAAFGEMPALVVLMTAAIVGLGLTELTSNTATAAAFFPIMGSVAIGVGIDPLVMTAVMTLAVCSAYMLPVATPSNAVAFGSGEVSIRQMVRAGVWLNLVSMVVIFLMIETLFPLVLTR